MRYCSQGMDRDNALISIRPRIPHIETEATGKEVLHFQNTVLRQVIKFQHDLILDIFRQFLRVRKINLNDLDFETRKLKIQQVFLKEKVLKASLEGIIIGHLTVEEYALFCVHEQEIRKRIRDIIKQRIWDSMEELFE